MALQKKRVINSVTIIPSNQTVKVINIVEIWEGGTKNGEMIASSNEIDRFGPDDDVSKQPPLVQAIHKLL